MDSNDHKYSGTADRYGDAKYMDDAVGKDLGAVIVPRELR